LIFSVAGGVLLYALAFTWLWIDQHAGEVGSRLLPWSYVINSVRHSQQAAHDGMTFSPLADAMPLPLGQRPRVVVLVIGESARADRQSALGYGRPTNDYTQSVGALSLTGVQACASYTIAALNCILSHRGDEVPERSNMGEPLPSYLQRQGVEVIWRTSNSGHPPIQVSRFESLGNIQANCKTTDCPPDRLDEGLLYGLRDLLAQSKAKRVLVVLHLNGSHGPRYHEKYPEQFERFKPVCQSVVLQDCDRESLNNAYDNSILYTDHVLWRLTQTLQQLDASTAWMYLSDHGESLGESGLYLHGTPRLVAPNEQIDIPMSFWFSDALRREVHIDQTRIQAMRGVGQGHVFHTVMGLLALKGGPYRMKLDLLNAWRAEAQ
jgi:lipid A ethanolaminephosphotransferase